MEAIDLADVLTPERAYASRTETIFLEGTPVQWQRARRNGNVYFSAPKMRNFQEGAAFQARSQWSTAPCETACCLDLISILPRPLNHFAHGGVREDAPFFCVSHKSGDSDNHLKGICDAMEGILYKDDCLIVATSSYKVYADCRPDNRARVGGELPVGSIIRFAVVDEEWVGN